MEKTTKKEWLDPKNWNRRKYEGLERLTKEVQRIAAPILGSRGFSGVDVLSYWDEIVGENLSKGIRPEKLTFDHENRINGTLHVKSAGGAFAVLFEHQKNHVIRRINAYFGYQAVSRIKITQGKLKLNSLNFPQTETKLSVEKQKELKQKVKDIKDKELRDLVYKIGETLTKKNSLR